jgi:LCP family protein required for cell wall assembly
MEVYVYMRLNKQKKKRRGLRMIKILVLLLFVGLGAYGFSVYQSLNDAVATMNQYADRKSEKRAEELELANKEPFSVLVLGVDEREGDRGRSDSIIVLTVNPDLNSVKMLSIPRDTYTEIVGNGTTDKINHAFAFGGVEMAMDTVENFLDIPLDYYLEINMEGFKDIVDAVGGITVNNDLDFTYSNVHFPEGELTLDGKKALIYSRVRKQDPRGDFGRQLRQRQVIEAIIKEGASFSSLANYDKILEAISMNVKTNLTINEMISIQKNYKSASKDIEQLSITGNGISINSIYYYDVPEEEKLRLQTELKEHLDI